MLQFSRLSKSYGAKTLFKNVTWHIPAHTRAALVGVNGAGKTTLFRILAGQEEPDEGFVQHVGDATFGYLPQELDRIDAGTVLERILSGAPQAQALERSIADTEAALAQATDAEQLTELSAHYADLMQRYTLLDAGSLEGRAQSIALGLGLRATDMHRSLSELSGGYFMRVELARLLLQNPDLLLLDEPTNHLDAASLLWLEQFLKTYVGSWFIVSHDRYFLNRVVETVVELHPEGLLFFPGNYDDYCEAREAMIEQQQAEAEQRSKQMAHLQEFVDRFRYKASKAKQAQSKLRQIEKIEQQAPVALELSKKKIHFELPQVLKSGDIPIMLEGVSKSFGDKRIYEGLDLKIERGMKLALIGENGAGKSTLLKLLGQVIQPDSGSCSFGYQTLPYYFAQHQAELLNPEMTVLQTMRVCLPEASESKVRGILGAFLFQGDAVDKFIHMLSGGEKARLVLAQMLVQPYNVLLLDEPTNHLDLESCAVLEHALQAYSGTIIFVSHDRYFTQQVATHILSIVPQKMPYIYPGTYNEYLLSEYHQSMTAHSENSIKSEEQLTKSQSALEREERKHQAREQAKKDKEKQQLEQRIHEAEQRLAEIDTLLCDEAIFSNVAQCELLSQERETIAQTLEQCYTRWMNF